MKIACMQPYFLPYIGYWQLIKDVDSFIILDDVNFIKKGWINRNKILAGEKEHWITLPLEKASKNKVIREINICDSQMWLPKMRRKIDYIYNSSMYYKKNIGLINNIFDFKEKSLVPFIENSIILLCEYLGIGFSYKRSSLIDPKTKSSGQQRIIDICKIINAHTYVNPIGGLNLYNQSNFIQEDIKLKFISSLNVYKYSILHWILTKSQNSIKDAINNYKLI